MKYLRLITRSAVGLALTGMLLPAHLASAQAPAARPLATESAPAAAPTAPEISDIALAAGGEFSGQVVDTAGRPQAASAVMLLQQQHVVATTTTNQDGRFSIRGLQGGMYQVVSGENMKNYRLWAADTAPPTAQKSAMLVSSSQVVRGQSGWKRWVFNPWVLAVGVATAIAVPIALSNRSKASSS
jgi:Carboxypeptidase regulatory-like domain